MIVRLLWRLWTWLARIDLDTPWTDTIHRRTRWLDAITDWPDGTPFTEDPPPSSPRCLP